jgi:hypothetical protein
VALPVVMLGLNQTIMAALSALAIAAVVGTRELGQQVYIALGKADAGLGFVALSIALLAMISDRIIRGWCRRQARRRVRHGGPAAARTPLDHPMADYSLWCWNTPPRPGTSGDILRQPRRPIAAYALLLCGAALQDHRHGGCRLQPRRLQPGALLWVEHWHDPRRCSHAGFGRRMDTIFITRAHFDHFGNVDAFPKAHFYIARQEIGARSGRCPSRRMGSPRPSIRRSDKGRRPSPPGAAALVDTDMEDASGIDLHSPSIPTARFHVVRLRNDGRRIEDCWCWPATHLFLRQYRRACDRHRCGRLASIGIAVGSQENLLHASEAMLKAVAYERRRVPVHEEALARVYPTREVAPGLAISEICLADGAVSMLR